MLENLNKEQQEAVITNGKHVRVIAGAGSGKTRVLTTRIVYLIETQHVAPWRICAITFTNKAAQEMKARLERMHPDAMRTHLSTIHALCMRIVREEHETLGLPRSFTVLDTSDQHAVLKEIYDALGIKRKDLSYHDAINYISNNKMAKVSVANAKTLAGNHPIESLKCSIYARYEKRLKGLYALDFDDLLLVVDNMFIKDAQVRLRWQGKFDAILVDEFQDVDAVQYSIVTQLAGTENQLYVVGDPDQTIYSWRGADVDFILDFESRYPDAITITMDKNYRSTQAILDGANTLIANNKNRPDKTLIAHKKDDIPVEVIGLDDQETESYYVMRQILRWHDAGVDYLDMAVLYRSNYLSRSLEKLLMQRQIPYVIYGGLRFYDHAEIKDLLAFMRMITHADDLALRRSIQMPRRGVGDTTLEKIFAESSNAGLSMYEYLALQFNEGTLPKRLAAYYELIESFKAYSQSHSIEETMHYVYEASGLMAHYENLDELSRLENLHELIEDARQFERTQEEGTLVDYIQMITLFSDRNEVTEGSFVRLMTVHAAKGLEFNHVVILGVNDQVFPNKRALSEGVKGLEEERRLMYVAMTRAKDVLVVTYHKGHSFVTQTYGRASRFIEEMSVPDEVEVTPAASQGAFNATHTYKKADRVVHEAFGEGIVIGVEGALVRVAFNYPHNLKTIAVGFNGMRPKETLS